MTITGMHGPNVMMNVTGTHGLSPSHDHDMARHPTSQMNPKGHQMHETQDKTRMNEHAKNVKNAEKAEMKRRRV